MEACITNLLEPGETIIIGDKGIWGERAADMAGRFGGAARPGPATNQHQAMSCVLGRFLATLLEV